MRQHVRWFVVVLGLFGAACDTPSIKEIQVKATCPCPAGSQVSLALDVDSKQAVTYQWHSEEGGSFDYPESPQPRFTVPQTNTNNVHVYCTVLIEGKPTVRSVLLKVSAPVAGAASPTPAPNAPAPDVALSPPPPPASKEAAGAGPFDIERNGFVASGWMGDGLRGRQFISPQSRTGDTQHPTCQKWTYTPGGDQGWVSIVWQFPANNWGSELGVDLSRRRIREVSFWARGVADSSGNLPKVRFKAGGSTDPKNPHQDSFTYEMQQAVTLPLAWTQYRMPLAGRDLSSVISGFGFIAEIANNRNGVVFYLAEIEYR